MKIEVLSNKRRHGAVLMIVMGFITLCAVITGIIAFNVDNSARQTRRLLAMEQAFFLAEAGAERGAAYVAEGNNQPTTLSGNLGEGSYFTSVNSEARGGGSYSYDIVSTGTVSGVSRVVTMRGVRNVSWARYALWYDKEAPAGLVMVPGEEFYGRVYSKPQIRFYGTGVKESERVHFYDRVWTGASSYKVDSTSAEPILDRGIIYNATEESMIPVNFVDLYNQANNSANGYVFDGPTTIVIDGKDMYITNELKSWESQKITIPNNGIVYVKTTTVPGHYVEKQVWVPKLTYWPYTAAHWETQQVWIPGGTYTGDLIVKGPNGLDGKLTLVVENNITVADHIRYKKNPQTNTSSTDTLGLIAKKDVIVGTDAPNKAPNNLEIYAHIIAVEGGFGVHKYNQGSARGTLTVFGGIANKIRKAVGQTTPTGYVKKYIFDDRLIDNPPPFYPERENELEWSIWEG